MWELTPEILTNVSRLGAKSRKTAFRIIGEKEFEKIADDPLYWLDASQHVKTKQFPEGLPYVYTKDPHPLYKCVSCDIELFAEKRTPHLKAEHNLDGVVTLKLLRESFEELNATRPFTVIEYMPPIVNAWVDAQLMVLEKSRDMMATWLMVALFSWDTFFHKGRQHLFQSMDSGKTDELVQRARIIYDNQPEFLRDAIGPADYRMGTTKSGSLIFPKQGSEILGFPQGPDQIRQYHPSGIYTDETAFQIQAEEAFAAIKPAIQAGGKYCGISSANRSFFEKLARDLSDQ